MTPALRRAIALTLHTQGALWDEDNATIQGSQRELSALWPTLSGKEQEKVRELAMLLFDFRQRIDPVDPATLPATGRRVIFLEDEGDPENES